MQQYEHPKLKGENKEFAKQQSHKQQDTRYCSCTEFVKRVSE